MNYSIQIDFIFETVYLFCLAQTHSLRGVINGKAAALPKFSDTLTLSQQGGVILCPPIGVALPLKIP